jgi:hypothetical protein
MTQGLLLNPRIISEETLLEMYNKALSLVAEGKTYTHFSGEGTEFTTGYPIPVQTMLSEIAYCLQQKNPAKYGHILTQVKPNFI